MFRPDGVFPNSCQTCCCSRTEKCDSAEENGKCIQNNRASASSLRQRMRRRSSNQRRVTRWSSQNCLYFASPPPPSSPVLNCFHLFSFFFSPPCSVLFRSDFLALGAAERKGEERGQLMEKIWGKIALAFFVSVFSLYVDNFQ